MRRKKILNSVFATNPEVIIFCAVLGGVILLAVGWYLFGGGGGYVIEPIDVEDEEITLKSEIMSNIGTEVCGAVNTANVDSLVPITCTFGKHCYMCGFAISDFLFRFYIYKKRIDYTITDFLTGHTINNTLKINKGVIDYAALGGLLREDVKSCTRNVDDITALVDKADEAAENKDLSDDDLIDSLFTLAKEAAAKHDDVLAVAILTGLFRYAPDEVDNYMDNENINEGGEE